MPFPQSEDLPSESDYQDKSDARNGGESSTPDAVAARMADLDWGLFGGTHEAVDDDPPPPPAGKRPPPGVYDPTYFQFEPVADEP